MRAHLVACLVLVGCVKPSPCKKGTILVTVSLDAASAAATSLAVVVRTGTATRQGAPIPHRAGTSGGTLEIDFAAGYPAGQTALIEIDALDGTRLVGRGRQTMTLAPSCSSESITLKGVVAGAGDMGKSAPDGGGCDPTSCPNGYCIDGVCCDKPCDGQCEACDLPGSVGTCMPVSGTPHGTRPSCTGAGTVCGGQCDGQNTTGCVYPPTTTSCGAQSCASGMKTLASSCDGAGSCNVAVVLTCTPAMCNAGNTDCASTCSNDAGCAAFAGKPYCDHGVCTAHLPNGRNCSSDGDCNNAHCVDGVCCDRACGGQCEACDLAGSVGTCAPVTSGAPHGTRPACGGSGPCQGSCAAGQTQTCTMPSVQCGGGTCANGVATPPVYCSGGSCPSVSTTPCANGLGCSSDGSACKPGPCVADADCQNGYFCAAGGTCTPKVAIAGKCNPSSDCNAQSNCNECASGFCVDGVCCDRACGGQCEACDTSTAKGTCTTISGAPHGTRAGCGGTGVCAGSCGGNDSSQCAFPTVDCTSQSCSNNTVTFASSCVQGVCTAPTPPTLSCGSQVCVGSACGGCTADADCTSTQYCNSAGQCVARLGNGLQCHRQAAGSNSACYNGGDCQECSSGFCVDGYCCGSACNGQCQNCNVNPGTCSLTGSSSSPRQPVNDTSTNRGSCMGSGTCQWVCNGSSASCVTQPPKICRLQSCSGDTQINAASCAADGTCPAEMDTSCGAYQCDSTNTTCKSGCTADSDCQIGNYCNSLGKCVAQKSNGGTCNAINDCYGGGNCAECSSGHCVSGICCNAICNGPCEACDNSNGGTAGSCHAAVANSKVSGCATDNTNCYGGCDGTHLSCQYSTDGNGCNLGTGCGYCSSGGCTSSHGKCGAFCCSSGDTCDSMLVNGKPVFMCVPKGV